MLLLIYSIEAWDSSTVNTLAAVPVRSDWKRNLSDALGRSNRTCMAASVRTYLTSFLRMSTTTSMEFHFVLSIYLYSKAPPPNPQIESQLSLWARATIYHYISNVHQYIVYVSMTKIFLNILQLIAGNLGFIYIKCGKYQNYQNYPYHQNLTINSVSKVIFSGNNKVVHGNLL